MHITYTILERPLILDEKSLQRAQEALQVKYASTSSPRYASRQIKVAISNTQLQRVIAILEQWGKLMWSSSIETTEEEQWGFGFSVLIMIFLAIDKK
jgi:hypothetical protein